MGRLHFANILDHSGATDKRSLVLYGAEGGGKTHLFDPPHLSTDALGLPRQIHPEL